QWVLVKEGENILKIDTPCGRITSFINVHNDEIKGVRFHCVPSFVIGLDRKVNIPGIGIVNYDLAYGGAFYAYVDLQKNNLNFDLSEKYYRNLIQTGMDIKQAVNQQDQEILHPFEKDLSFLYGTIFIDVSAKENIDSKNVCIFADGEVDRSPTGSGVAGRMAIHKARHEIDFGQKMTIESITCSVFKGSVISEIDYGPFKAVIPEVEGTAHITGTHTFLFDPKDPKKNGFILR
ncbi:MAG: proline racemase, partial [Flavobacteriaceae bacterium]|nr:proline racemase [Flavobacteriaceae bacterium]